MKTFRAVEQIRTPAIFALTQVSFKLRYESIVYFTKSCQSKGITLEEG